MVFKSAGSYASRTLTSFGFALTHWTGARRFKFAPDLLRGRTPSPLRGSLLRCGGGPAHAVACRRQCRTIGLARPRVAEILRGCGGSFPISANLSAASFRLKPCENRTKPLVCHSGKGRDPVKRACDTNPPNWDSHSQLAAFSTFASTLSIASPAEWRAPWSHAVRTKPDHEPRSAL